MTYENIVEKLKKTLGKGSTAYADHYAIQVNVTGEGEGILYIELEGGKVIVEPYDYWDNHAVLTSTGETLFDITDKKYTFKEAFENEKVFISGDFDAITRLDEIKFKKLPSKAVKDAAAKAAEDVKETTAKETKKTKAAASKETKKVKESAAKEAKKIKETAAKEAKKIKEAAKEDVKEVKESASKEVKKVKEKAASKKTKAK